jgi:hypothetical protein
VEAVQLRSSTQTRLFLPPRENLVGLTWTGYGYVIRQGAANLGVVRCMGEPVPAPRSEFDRDF